MIVFNIKINDRQYSLYHPVTYYLSRIFRNIVNPISSNYLHNDIDDDESTAVTSSDSGLNPSVRVCLVFVCHKMILTS